MFEQLNNGVDPRPYRDRRLEARLKSAQAIAKKYGRYYSVLSPLEREAYLAARSALPSDGLDSEIALLRRTIQLVLNKDPHSRDLIPALRLLARLERTNKSLKRNAGRESRGGNIIDATSHLIQKDNSSLK